MTYHHPHAEPVAWKAFLTLAGLDDREPGTRELLRILPLVRLLEILDEELMGDQEAGHWVRMLEAGLGRLR